MYIFRETALHHQEYINALVRQVTTITKHSIPLQFNKLINLLYICTCVHLLGFIRGRYRG